MSIITCENYSLRQKAIKSWEEKSRSSQKCFGKSFKSLRQFNVLVKQHDKIL